MKKSPQEFTRFGSADFQYFKIFQYFKANFHIYRFSSLFTMDCLSPSFKTSLGKWLKTTIKQKEIQEKFKKNSWPPYPPKLTVSQCCHYANIQQIFIECLLHAWAVLGNCDMLFSKRLMFWSLTEANYYRSIMWIRGKPMWMDRALRTQGLTNGSISAFPW